MPVSSPSYFPPNRANGTIVGITAGNTNTGSRNFLAGKNAGNYLQESDVIVIGDSALSAGTNSAPINDANFQYSVIIGSGSLAKYIGVTAGSASGGIVCIGGNNFALMQQGLAGSVVVGVSNGQNAILNTQNGANVIIGFDNWSFASATGVLNEFDYNVTVGTQCVSAGSAGAGNYLGNTLIGYQAGYALNGGTGSSDYNTFIGYNAGKSINGSGNASNYNVCLGANAGANNYAAYQGIVLIGCFAGQNHGADAASYVAAIESSVGGCLFARMDTGNVILGNVAASGANRTFPANATNILKLPNGTVGTASPTGGGYFYVTAGALHWVGSNGTDSEIAPA